MTAGERVGTEAAQEAERAAAEVHDVVARERAAEQKRSADRRIARRRAAGKPHRDHVMRGQAWQVGAHAIMASKSGMPKNGTE